MVEKQRAQQRRATEIEMDSEAELIARARQYSFRARMDKGEVAGPVFVSGQGSEEEDVTGRRSLDFNSGQAFASFGPHHATVHAAIKKARKQLDHTQTS